ncbi:MAG: ribosome biogenesis GTPase Der [Pseudomonadota bacterium]
MSLTIALIGRPNVGKSTLFNRLVGKRLALVDDTPGVTRDRRAGTGRIADLTFEVVDTAGLEDADEDSLEGRMREQTERAIEDADLCLFLVDARVGVTPDDKAFATLLRRSGTPFLLVANKAEGKQGEAGYYDAFSLGFGEPVAISAEHGEGVYDLYDAILAAVGEEAAFGEAEEPEPDEAIVEVELDEDAELDEGEANDFIDPERPLRIAVVGRPNAGKSTLINELLGEDRLLTGPEAGITRDSISVDLSVEHQGIERKLKFFDTAGMRKRARVNEKLEKLSVADGLRAIKFAEVVVVVLDATIPFEKQDLQIADLVIREGRALVLAFNKWDLIEDRQAHLADLREKTERLLPQVRGVRAVPISGQTGSGLDKLMDSIFLSYAVWNSRISTARLNKWLDYQIYHHPPPAVAGRRIRLKYMTQAKTRPPTFMVSCSRPEGLPTAYSRYLINGLRQDFDMAGTPIRLYMRKGDNPYANRKKR